MAKMGINFKNGPTPDRDAVPNPAKRRRHAFSAVAFLAVLAVGLLFLLPGGLLQAQSGDARMEYAENGTDPVATYTGIDPEGRPIYWSLLPVNGDADFNNDGDHIDDAGETRPSTDAADFMISGDGVLTFKFSPDYEIPTSAIPDNEELPAKNVYNVVVMASDDAPDAGTLLNPIKVAYHKVTVTVTDVDEDGSISLSAQQPQVGVDLTATLTDQDATDEQKTNAKRKWEQSSAMDGPWIVIVGATAAAYDPVAGVVDKYLRATVTYTDKHGDDKTAMAVSAHAVRAVPAGRNSSPVFPAGSNARNVKENSPPGTDVGKPVAAGDAGDILTYTLTETDGSNYRIDRATGQITVGPRAMLNREDQAFTDSTSQHTVTVIATDPWGITAPDDDRGAVSAVTVTDNVTITIDNVNEAPKVTSGPTKASVEEDFDSNPNPADEGERELDVGAYMADDPETVAEELVWSRTGADAGGFEISVNGVLSFKEAPNFESPADADMDNIYMVTVVATDSGTPEMTATRDVVITVTNADDDGTITLSSVQPKVGIDFTATLSDPDGGVKDVKWQWASAIREVQGDCPGAEAPNGNGAWTNIPKAKSDTYRPVATDATGTKCLQATATYTDSHGSGKSAMVKSDNDVVLDRENRAPVFRAGGVAGGKVITSDTRSIAENSASDTNGGVGAAVVAIDPNGTGDTLTYTLGGSDKSSFVIEPTDGQITVGAGTKLDYEGKKVYRVTVTATDPSQASATIPITINVTDVDERPVIAGDDIVKDFRENSASTVQTFRATDPERRPVYWSLKDDSDYPDHGDFTISSTGALSFANPPDFEAPIDSDPNNIYKVIVLAHDDALGAGGAGDEYGGLPSEKKVTVTVTNVAEQGSISLDRRYPQVGIVVEATLTDGDRVTDDLGPTWQWYKGNTKLLDGNGANTRSYTPQVSDIRTTIRVEANYNAKGDSRTAKSPGINVRAEPPSNAAPTFPQSTAARSVEENRPAGTTVGATIVADDTDSADSGKLTYSVPDDGDFSITTRGQLKTKAPLNHEDAATVTVTVTATDPSNATGTVTVTITVKNVNEAPTIATGPTRATDWPEDKGITEMVATYTATDRDVDDRDTLAWSLTGTDASDFEISDGGVLTFKEVPDFEKPAASNNVYRVTVKVSDGKLSATRPMTVTVTDVAEGGVVTLSSVQPKVAVELTASLEDSDGGVKDITWQWARSESATDGFTDIDGATSATYTPVKDAAPPPPMFLRAMASYTDSQGEQTAMKVSDRAVIANTDNRAPMFPDTETGMREVDELTPAKEDIGIGVKATDPNPNENLTYTLSGADAASFTIVRITGVLQTKAKLDYEAKNTYMVTVKAADPNGLSDTIDVTIVVIDVDEAPEIITGGLVVTGTSDTNYAENGMGMVATYSAAGPDAAGATWSLSGADAGALSISSAGVLTFSPSPNYESPADANTDNIYMVMVNANDGTNDAMKTVSVRVTNEEEMGEVTLWAGADALTMAPQVGETITGAVMDPDGGVTGETWQWAKTMTPDMMDSWMPITGATDAAYMVTADDTGYHLRVMATYTDAAGTDMAMEYSMPTMMVTVVVEMMGEVTLWAGDDALTMAPQVGDTITGAVMDPDGGVTGETWQWSRTMDTADTSSWMDIAGETNAAYTVTAGDTGYYLRATAMYDDGEGMGKMASEETMMVMMMTMNAAPMFESETDTREVAENTAAGEDIGNPVAASDANDDALDYTLGGADVASFAIDSDTGQLMTLAALDFEIKPTYSVTVTASDSGGLSDSIDVTITVTDVDEQEPEDPVERYDVNKSGRIDKDELADGVFDYNIEQTLSKDDLADLIFSYEIG